MNQTRPLFVVLLLLIGLTGALWVASGRIAVERANRTVALCLDDLEVRQLAALNGQPLHQLLTRFRDSGATHLAVTERTFGELLQEGSLRLESREGEQATFSGPGALLVHLSQAIRKLPAAAVNLQTRPLGSGAPPARQTGLLTAPAIVTSMPDLGVVYDPDSVRQAFEAKLRVVARPRPDLLVTPEAVDISLHTARQTGADIVLFNGVSVAGGPLLARTTAESLVRHNLRFGYVELVPQEGEGQLAAALKYHLIRTHSISQEEMTKTAPSRGVDRFVLAVTERNVRLCYVRLHLVPRPDIIQANCDYVGTIAQQLRDAGYNLGPPTPFSPLGLPRPALVLLALGVLGGGLALLGTLGPLPAKWFWGLAAIGALACVAGPFAAFGPMRILVSLGAGVIFPSLAILHTALVADQTLPPKMSPGALRCLVMELAPTGSPLRPYLGAIGLTARAAFLTALGGLILAGALSSSDYMMQVSQFRGVKLAQLLPMVLVLVATLARSLPAWRESVPGWAAWRAALVAAGGAVVRYWHAIAIMVALGTVAFMVMRSGNQSAVEVSEFELRLRAILDQVLLVRPRTKEILVGYPALMLGLWLLLRGRPRASWVLLSLGAISQVSLLNTFCHLHTPLTVSLLRAVNGLWVGLAVGGVWWLLRFAGERVLRVIWWSSPP